MIDRKQLLKLVARLDVYTAIVATLTMLAVVAVLLWGSAVA